MPRLTVLTREGCDLCEEMLAELQRFCAGRAAHGTDQSPATSDPSPAISDRPAAIEVVDVDSDAALRSRYGLKVPVLLLDGEQVCYGRFDAAELTRLLRRR